MDEQNVLVRERLRKLEELERAGVDPYPARFTVRHLAADLHREYAALSEEQAAGPEVAEEALAKTLVKIRPWAGVSTHAGLSGRGDR